MPISGRTTGGAVVISTKQRHQRLAWRFRFLRTRRGAERALSHRESGARAQAAVLAAELCRHHRRPDRERQAMGLHRLRDGERARQHQLQSRQPHAIQCARSAGARRTDSQYQLHPGASIRSRALPVDTWVTCASTGRSRSVRSGSCATRMDNYTTNNALVQQATLPSTGATTHSNYQNVVISNTFTFSPIVGWQSSHLGTSYLHGTADRNAIPRIRAGVSLQLHLEDHLRFRNLWRQPVRHRRSPRFPVLRNQEKYQFRYDVSGSVGQARSQVRRRLHSRAGAERRVSRHRRRHSTCSPRIQLTT